MKKTKDMNALLRLDGYPVATATTVSLSGEIDKRVRRVFKMCEDSSDTVKAAANAAIREYVEGQRALFKSKGMQPDRALKEAIVPTGERLSSGTEIVRIVPRGETLEELVDDNGDHALSISASRGYSDRVGVAKDQRRGKYNDGHMLINQSSCSVDASEVIPFAYC